MRTLVINYDKLAKLEIEGNKISKYKEEYVRQLEKKIIASLHNVLDEYSSNISDAETFLKNKMAALNEDSEQMKDFLKQVNELLELADAMDREVAALYQDNREMFKGISSKVGGNDGMWSIFHSLRDGIKAFAYSALEVLGLKDIDKKLKTKLRYWYEYEGGKDFLKLVEQRKLNGLEVTGLIGGALALVTAGAVIGTSAITKTTIGIANGLIGVLNSKNLIKQSKNNKTDSLKYKVEIKNQAKNMGDVLKGKEVSSTSKNTDTIKNLKNKEIDVNVGKVKDVKNIDVVSKDSKETKKVKETKETKKTTEKTELKDEVKTLVDRLKNDKSLGLSKKKKDAIVDMAETLLNEGYEVAFVAGVLGNVIAEGTPGYFESSAYISNPKAEPAYLKYMDENYNYRKKFSGKTLSEVGIKETYRVLKELKEKKYKGKFGLGSIQWTGGRTMKLIETYIELYGEDYYPTEAECRVAENRMMLKELKGDYNKSVYQKWKSEYGKSKEGADAAYGAGSIVCKHYEIPHDTDNQAKIRAKNAKNIYNVMMGSK